MTESTYLLIDGQFYVVPDKTEEDLRTDITTMLDQGTRLDLTVEVALKEPPKDGAQRATLHLHGARLGAVALVTWIDQEGAPTAHGVTTDAGDGGGDAGDGGGPTGGEGDGGTGTAHGGKEGAATAHVR